MTSPRPIEEKKNPAHTSTTAAYSLFGNKVGLLDTLYQEAALRFAAGLAEVGETDDLNADLAHGLVSVELSGTLPDGVDVAAGYEVALRAVVDGWRISG